MHHKAAPCASIEEGEVSVDCKGELRGMGWLEECREGIYKGKKL